MFGRVRGAAVDHFQGILLVFEHILPGAEGIPGFILPCIQGNLQFPFYVGQGRFIGKVYQALRIALQIVHFVLRWMLQPVEKLTGLGRSFAVYHDGFPGAIVVDTVFRVWLLVEQVVDQLVPLIANSTAGVEILREVGSVLGSQVFTVEVSGVAKNSAETIAGNRGRVNSGSIQ